MTGNAIDNAMPTEGGLDLFGMVALFVAPRILPALRRNGEESGDQ